jgi:hypothetical protein
MNLNEENWKGGGNQHLLLSMHASGNFSPEISSIDRETTPDEIRRISKWLLGGEY